MCIPASLATGDFHYDRDGISNHQPHDCLLNRLFRRRSKKTVNLRVTGFCVGNSQVTGEFPAQRASNAENVSIWWRHHFFIAWLRFIFTYHLLLYRQPYSWKGQIWTTMYKQLHKGINYMYTLRCAQIWRFYLHLTNNDIRSPEWFIKRVVPLFISYGVCCSCFERDSLARYVVWDIKWCM